VLNTAEVDLEGCVRVLLARVRGVIGV
jgi:hypothetical protein